jgi:hypothetical protein
MPGYVLPAIFWPAGPDLVSAWQTPATSNEEKRMSETNATGSCLCGEVAYEVRAPIRMYHCHCSRCRRARSAAHTTNMFANLADFRFTRGEQLVAEYKVPEALRFGIAFCTRCGGKVARASRERGIVGVPVGALDTDPGMRPQANIFVASKASWYDITDALPQFAEMPPS